MNEFKNISQLDFDKLNGLIPAVIQDNKTLKVLMVGFMNLEAVEKTQEIGKVTFFSRTKNRLWTKVFLVRKLRAAHANVPLANDDFSSIGKYSAPFSLLREFL